MSSSGPHPGRGMFLVPTVDRFEAEHIQSLDGLKREADKGMCRGLGRDSA